MKISVLWHSKSGEVVVHSADSLHFAYGYAVDVVSSGHSEPCLGTTILVENACPEDIALAKSMYAPRHASREIKLVIA